MVAHPLSPQIDKVCAELDLTPWDRRIGQISSLSAWTSRSEAVEAILAACSQKTRNLVRKGLKQEFAIAPSDSDRDWADLATHHRIGMERIGGRPKSIDEFGALRATLIDGVQRRLYVARAGNTFAGALLCLHCKEWVEYFTPVAVEQFRSQQVLSALICEAMIDAAASGARFWNWGGTWHTQQGVYHFKAGWGAVDHEYVYYGRAADHVLDTPAEQLQANYPFFYARPFKFEQASRCSGAVGES